MTVNGGRPLDSLPAAMQESVLDQLAVAIGTDRSGLQEVMAKDAAEGDGATTVFELDKDMA